MDDVLGHACDALHIVRPEGKGTVDLLLFCQQYSDAEKMRRDSTIELVLAIIMLNIGCATEEGR